MTAIYSDLDQVVVPTNSGRCDHPDLQARNLLVRGIGHMSPAPPRRRRRRGRGDAGGRARRAAATAAPIRRRLIRVRLILSHTCRRRPGRSRPRRDDLYTSRHVLFGALSRPDSSLRFDHGAGDPPARRLAAPPADRLTAPDREALVREGASCLAAVHPRSSSGPGSSASPRGRRVDTDADGRSPTPPPTTPRTAGRRRRPRVPRPRRLAAGLPPAPPAGASPSRPAGALRCGSPPSSPARCWPMLPSLVGSPVAVTSDASDYGLGAASDVSLSGGIDDAGVRRSITEAEAQARLGELAASRAARAPKTVLPTQGRLTTCYCMRWGQMHYGLGPGRPARHADLLGRRRRRAQGRPGVRLRQRGLHPGRRRQRPHLRAHALLRRRGRPDRARRRPDRQGRQRGLLDRAAPALRDPPRRHGRPPARPRGLARRARRATI